jgi:hypothetical protein
MTNLINLIKDKKVTELYQKTSTKMIPTIKIGRGQILLSPVTYNLPSKYYVRKSKYPKPKYVLVDQYSNLKEWVSYILKLMGIDMKDNEYSFLQKLTPDEFKDKLRPFIVNGREIFERGEYALVMIDSRDRVYALHSTLFDDEEYYHDWWVTVDVLSFYEAHYSELVRRHEDKKYISAIRVKNLSNCWTSVPVQFDSEDYEGRLTYTKTSHYLVLTNKKTNEVINLKTAISTDRQLAIDSAYQWFEERELDITDLSNWLVEENK